MLAYRELCVTTTLASEEEILAHLVLPTGAPPPAPRGRDDSHHVVLGALAGVRLALGQDGEGDLVPLQLVVGPGETTVILKEIHHIALKYYTHTKFQNIIVG